MPHNTIPYICTHNSHHDTHKSTITWLYAFMTDNTQAHQGLIIICITTHWHHTIFIIVFNIHQSSCPTSNILQIEPITIYHNKISTQCDHEKITKFQLNRISILRKMATKLYFNRYFFQLCHFPLPLFSQAKIRTRNPQYSSNTPNHTNHHIFLSFNTHNNIIITSTHSMHSRTKPNKF